MNKLMMACVVLATATAIAADPKTAPTPAPAKPAEMKAMDAKPAEMGAAAANPMAQWKAPKVSKEDKKGIDDFYKAMEEAWKKGDAEGVAAMIDFPITMTTDSSSGATFAESWDRTKWMNMMKPMMANLPKDLKMSHKHKAEFLSDNLVSVIEDHSMTMGKEKSNWKSHCLVIKKDGKWMTKASTEGGWGDMMGAKGAMAPAGATDTKAAMK